jgi:DNA-binding CsgD family transcriptional regulator
MTPSTFAVSDDSIVRLHEAQTTQELVPALFAVFEAALPHHALVLILRPIEFELPSHCSRPEFQFLCDDYISGAHSDDIWLQRSPVDPQLPVVRHSDYTPVEMLHASAFYKRAMIPSGSEYGASLVAWRQGTWLASLTIFRAAGHGDFTDEELTILRTCHKHFQSAAIRVASLREAALGNHSLETFIWSLPTAALVLDWSLNVLHYNALALELCGHWRLGAAAARTKRSRKLLVPGDILAAIEQHKLEVQETKFNRPSAPSVIPILEYNHPTIPGLKTKVSFLPSKSLALTKGTFLIAIEYHSTQVENSGAYEKFSALTPRERDVALLAAKGMASPAIAQQLGTAHITVRMQLHTTYKKLGIKSRHELITLFSNHDLFTAATLRS